MYRPALAWLRRRSWRCRPFPREQTPARQRYRVCRDRCSPESFAMSVTATASVSARRAIRPNGSRSVWLISMRRSCGLRRGRTAGQCFCISLQVGLRHALRSADEVAGSSFMTASSPSAGSKGKASAITFGWLVPQWEVAKPMSASKPPGGVNTFKASFDADSSLHH